MKFKVHIIHHVDWDTEQITTQCSQLMNRDFQFHRENTSEYKKKICPICLENFNKEIKSWEQSPKGAGNE